jgi:hypothetical protein
MLSKTDLQLIKELIDESFDKKLTPFREEVTKEIINLYGEVGRLDQKIDHLRNDIVQFKDDILHEIVDLRDDITVATGYRDSLENHEQRITTLEKHVL